MFSKYILFSYEENVVHYFEAAFLDMDAVYELFLACLPQGNPRILDAGCGSGQDSLAFINRGYEVVSFDACAAMVHLARKNTGLPVQQDSILNFQDQVGFEGVWARVPDIEIPLHFNHLWKMVRPGGSLYTRFKQGKSPCADVTVDKIIEWTHDLSGVACRKFYVSAGVKNTDTRWLSVIFTKSVDILTG